MSRPWTKAHIALYVTSVLASIWTAAFMLVSGYAWMVPICCYSAYCAGREIHRNWDEGTH